MAARPHGAGALPAHPCWDWGRLRSAVSLRGPPLWSCQPVPTGTVPAATTPTPLGTAQRLPCSRALWLLAAVSVQNLHLCEGYAGPDGRYHPGFYCPRLTDPAGHRYCCQASPLALKSCCSRLALEAITGVNLSSLAPPSLLRNPLALPFVGLYGLLVLLLMAADLFHFYRTRRCRLGRLLPRARRPPRARPGGAPSPLPAAPRCRRPGAPRSGVLRGAVGGGGAGGGGGVTRSWGGGTRVRDTHGHTDGTRSRAGGRGPGGRRWRLPPPRPAPSAIAPSPGT
ncbi:uncharacterized protein FN964_008024 [Alca torda]